MSRHFPAALLEYLYGCPEKALPLMCLVASGFVGLLFGSLPLALGMAIFTLSAWWKASAYLVINDQRLGAIRLRCPEPDVWLTFDDGPGPQTLEMVRLLNRHDVSATFFFIGEQLASYPQLGELIEALGEGGHSVANHSFNHPNFLSQSRQEARQQMERTQRLLEDTFGERALSMFRPPFGYRKTCTFDQASALGLELVGWNVNSLDFLNGPPERVVNRLRHQILPGSIVLFHDGREGREVTLKALPDLVQWLKAQGYKAYNPLL
jgi:peptidoglycan/xylan/chitin deacetylase (PgdA/CDA1 family)